MDVEKIVHNSTDDDSITHSTQDHHDHDISSNLHMKKIYQPLNDFDSDEDNDGDNKTYQEKMWMFTDKKDNSTITISSICTEHKSRLFLSLCGMVPMPIVQHALKGDIIKLEADFFNGYRDGDCVFYISAIDS